MVDWNKVEKDVGKLIDKNLLLDLDEMTTLIVEYFKSLIEKEFKVVEKNTNRKFLGYLGGVIKTTKNMNKNK